jgi:hypothetical protein
VVRRNSIRTTTTITTNSSRRRLMMMTPATILRSGVVSRGTHTILMMKLFVFLLSFSVELLSRDEEEARFVYPI